MMNPDRLRAAVVQSFQKFGEQLAIYLPQLISGLVILLIGWLVARLLGRLTRRLLESLDSLFSRLARSDSGKSERLKRSYVLVVEKAVFWVTVVFVVTMSANVMGWTLFSRWMDSIVAYLPGLLTGVLIIMAGFLLGNLTRTAVSTASLRAGMQQSAIMARCAQIMVVFSTVIIGVEQIGLNVNFLSSLIVVIAGTLFAGASLAFSLGSRSLVANLLGTQNARKQCRPGETLRLGDVSGELVEITQQAIVLDTGSGRAIIPGKLFDELISEHTLPAATNRSKSRGSAMEEEV